MWRRKHSVKGSTPPPPSPLEEGRQQQRLSPFDEAGRDRRLSRSMESLDTILRTLDQIQRDPSWGSDERKGRRKPPNSKPVAEVEEAEAATDDDDLRKKLLLTELALRFRREKEDEERGEMAIDLAGEPPQTMPTDRPSPPPRASRRQKPVSVSNSSLDSLDSGGGAASQQHQQDPPPAPRPDDRFVGTSSSLPDWDMYRCGGGAAGRLFYHHPTSGQTRWKPPRGKKAPPPPKPQETPATAETRPDEYFSFASVEEDKEEDDDGHRVSFVRDSIR